MDYKDIEGTKLVGEENFEGHDCQIYTYNKDGNATKMWIAKDLQFPVKIETNSEKGPIVVIDRNVKRGLSLPDSLFDVPPGAQAIDMGNIGDMMKNMGMGLQ